MLSLLSPQVLIRPLWSYSTEQSLETWRVSARVMSYFSTIPLPPFGDTANFRMCNLLARTLTRLVRESDGLDCLKCGPYPN